MKCLSCSVGQLRGGVHHKDRPNWFNSVQLTSHTPNQTAPRARYAPSVAARYANLWQQYQPVVLASGGLSHH